MDTEFLQEATEQTKTAKYAEERTESWRDRIIVMKSSELSALELLAACGDFAGAYPIANVVKIVHELFVPGECSRCRDPGATLLCAGAGCRLRMEVGFAQGPQSGAVA